MSVDIIILNIFARKQSQQNNKNPTALSACTMALLFLTRGKAELQNAKRPGIVTLVGLLRCEKNHT